MNYWGAQLFEKPYRIESKKMTLTAANAADGIGDSSDRFMEGSRYEQ
jgi:hypothetical protein